MSEVHGQTGEPDCDRRTREPATGEVLREDRQHPEAENPGQQPVVELLGVCVALAEDRADAETGKRHRGETEESV